MKTKLIEGLKSQLAALIIGVLVVAIVFLKDVFNAGADVKFNARITYVIKSKDVKQYFDSLIHDAIDREMNDPFVLLEMLSSEHVNKFAEVKAEEVTNAVEKRLLKNDSIKGDMIHELGQGTGMRNEDIMPELIQLLKDYKSGRLSSNRNVRANF